MIIRKIAVDILKNGIQIVDILEPGRKIVVPHQDWMDRLERVAPLVIGKPLIKCDTFDRAQAIHDTCVGLLGELAP